MKLWSIPAVIRASLLMVGISYAGEWQSVAIGGGGFVTGLASSSDGTAIYMRTDVGGAYRWDAANTQWLPITDSLPNDANNNGHLYGIGAIAVDPANANRVFLACGKYNYSTPSGVYYCNNTSVASPTWTVIDSTVRVIGNGSFRSSGERLSVDPYNSNVVYFGTYNVGGVSGLRKYYYDTTWHTTTLTVPATGDVDRGISFVVADPTGGSVSDGTRTVSKYLYLGVYSATVGSGGVFASSNGGASWTLVTGLTFDKPFRGEVDGNGTLFVAGAGTVAKVARGTTTFTSITPVASLNYTGLAVDPNAANTVMVGEVLGSERLWRSTNGGSSWVVVTRTALATEPDGTRSLTTSGKFNNIADILITPGSPDEVWASDFLGVQRTQNIKDDTSASTWYTMQKNHEELVALMLKSAPAGAPMLSAVADCNGFAHDNPEERPATKFDNPRYISSTGLDFSEGSNSKIWARVGDIFYYTGTDSDRTGGTSRDGGRNWASFGQVDARSLTNSLTGAWEIFDVGDYLRQRKAAGVNAVTLVVRSSSWQTNQRYLHFSSKEGANPPEILIDGSTTLTPTADAMVYKGAPTSNYGNTTELQAQNYYDQASYTRWSYLKFDLSSVSSINSAVLRLYRIGISDTTGASYATVIHATPTTSWVEGDGGSDNVPANEINWNNKPADLCTPPSGATGGRVALSPTDSSRLVWVAENGYVWYSRDRGMTWARGTLNGTSLTVDSVSEFTTDRNALGSDRVAANTIYLYSKTGSGTVYRSTDGGATWASLVTGIGTANGYKLLAVPGQSGQFWFLDQNWNVAAHFKYWNGSSMATVPGISSAVDFAFGKAAPGHANPVVYVRKANGTYWASVDATAGSTFTWTAVEAPTLNCQPIVMEGDRQQYGRLYVGTGGRGLFYADVMPNSAETVEWTGGIGGTATSWNDGANWEGGSVPDADDTAVFTDTGLTSGKTIALNANQAIAKLLISTTTAFTIGASSDVTAGYALMLTSVEREDVAGTEGVHAFGAKITIVADANTNSTWSVAGDNVLRMNAVLASTGTVTFVKTGAGTFNLNYASPTFAGPWEVREGTITATVASAMRGNATVGGSSVAASLVQSVKNGLYNNMNVTVLNNGTFTAGDIDNGRVNSIHAKEGGTATVGSYFYSLKAALTGGQINGGTIFNGGFGQEIRSYSSASTGVFNCGFRFSSYYDAAIPVDDGPAPIDLKITKGLDLGGSSKALTKSGAGVAQLSAANTLAYGTLKVTGGTLLVDNTTGSGSGRSAVSVSAGATLGGTGIIGGVSGYSTANVTLAGSSSSRASLAPGTLNEDNGFAILGTLTVGSTAQTNNVSFGSYSRLALHLASDGSHDQLTVHGAVDLSGTTDMIELELAANIPPSTYTLISSDAGITGVFDTVSGLPAGAVLSYSDKAVQITMGGSIVQETWTGIAGTLISSIPVNTTPNSTTSLSSFEIPVNARDYYGTRVRGFFIPPTSGNYTFWISSDDSGELWLSSTMSPTNRSRIAYVSGWTSSREWNKMSSQKSASIPLVAGKAYYIEALMKENAGGDNLAIACRYNNATTPTNGDGTYLINGSQLAPYKFETEDTVVTLAAASPLEELVWTASSTSNPLTLAFKTSGGTNNSLGVAELAFAANAIGIIVSETLTNETFVVPGILVTSDPDANGDVSGTVTMPPEVLEKYDSLFIHGIRTSD